MLLKESPTAALHQGSMDALAATSPLHAKGVRSIRDGEALQRNGVVLVSNVDRAVMYMFHIQS